MPQALKKSGNISNKMGVALQHPIDSIEVKNDACLGGLDLSVLYSRRIQHFAGGCHSGGIMILVGEINDLSDSRLNNRLRTFVTGEKTYVQHCARKLLSTGVKNGVKLGVNHVLILRFARALISVPGELVVRAALGKAVVACGENTLVSVDYTCANLGAGVFGSLRRKDCYAHKIFVPGNIILSFFHS